MNALVANKLKTLRKQKNWSQEEVAHKLNISQSAYGRIEKGESNSWASNIEPICKIYEIQPEDLLKQENIIVNQNQKGGNGAFIINQLSEKLIEQYEIRLQEKDKEIANLKNKLEEIN